MALSRPRPTATLAYLNHSAMQNTYYKVNPSRLKLTEIWRMSPNLVALLSLIVVKIFRINVRSQFGMGHGDNILSVEWDDVPQESKAALESRAGELQPLGFRPCLVRKADSLGTRAVYSQFLLHSDRSVIVDVTHCTIEQHGRRIIEETVFFASQLTNGTFVLTTGNKSVPVMKHPIDLKIVKTTDLRAQLAMHRDRMANQPAAPKTFNNEMEIESSVQEMERLQFDQMIQRKLFVPLSDSERDHIESVQQKFADLGGDRIPPQSAEGQTDSINEAPGLHSNPPVVGTPSEHVDSGLPNLDTELHPEDRSVLTQIHSVNLQSSNWVSKLLLLVLSLVAFAALGAWAWDWYIVALLIPILFFHELGHYIAMRVLKYKNVKMFFLPLFGAAVQGRSHNAPGWQRAVVALAGPIPGIIVGCAILYLFHDQRILAVIGLATIFLNALNLLPFLPLDGGWVVQTTLFSRNQYLDFLFRVAAVVGLGAIGFWFGAKIIIGLAVLMGFGLPYQWRVGKLTHQLKREGLKPEPSSHDELCEPTVFEIVQRLRTDTNISTPMRSAAAFSIYELLSAKPPGILASLALLFTQATGFFGSIIFALWVMQLAWFGPGNPQGPMFPSVPEPEVELASAESVAPSPNVKLDQQTPETIYVNCATSKRMQQAWQALSNETGVVVSRFGQTIVIELLKDDPKLSEEMMVIARALDAGAFVSEHNLKVGVEIGFEADSPDEAQRITAQLDQYFFATEFEIAPPWLKGLDLNPGFQQARLTLHEIQQIDLDIETDEELDELISSAYEKREQQEILKALQKLQEQQKQQRTIAIRQYLAANANADQRVVDQWLEMNNGVALSANLPESAEEMEARHSQRLDAMAKLLGPLPETLEENRRFDYSILSGYSVVEGNYVRVHQLQCYRPTTAIQAITAWLEKEGASKIRYSLYDTHALFESMIEE